MLKTFIASIRSDKAVKELDKIGVKVREVGEDGIERFRDVRSVILDLSLQAKYAEKDLQKTLLAVSGGKFQWSKVSAMLSDYREIIDNWEKAIQSDKFTSEQVAGQLDTIARKYQSLKTELTAIIMESANGGLTNTIKNILDGLNNLMYALQSLSTYFYSGVLKAGEFALCLYAAHKAVNVLASSLVELGITAEVTSLKINSAFAKNIIGIALFAVASALEIYMQKQKELEQRTKKTAEEEIKLYAAQGQKLAICKREAEYVTVLCDSYKNLATSLQNSNITSEKRAKISEDLSYIEKKLSTQMGDAAVANIKNAEDVASAVDKEKEEYLKANADKQEAIKKFLSKKEAEMTSLNKYTEKAIDDYYRDAAEFSANIESKIDDIQTFMSWSVACYKLETLIDMARRKMAKNRLEDIRSRRETVAQQISEVENNNEKSWYSPFMPSQKDQLDFLKQEMTELAFQEQKIATQINELDKDVYEDSQKLYYEATHGIIDKLKEDNNKSGQFLLDNDGKNKPSFTPDKGPGGTETEPMTDKGGKNQGGRSSRYNPSKEHDPIVTAINNAVKLIEKKFDRQIKSIEQDIKEKGANKALTEQRWHFHEEKLNALKEQLEKAKAHAKEQDAAIFDSEITIDNSKEIREGILSEAKDWHGIRYIFGGETRDGIDCSAFVRNVFREKGIQISRTVDAQAEDYARKGALKDTLDGAQIGDLVFFDNNNHIGIISGKDENGNYQMIHSSSSKGVDYDSLAPGGYWYGRINNVGRTSEYTDMAVPFSKKLSEVIKITKEEWVKAGIDGQQALIENAMNSEEYKEDENTLKFLNAVKIKILEPVKQINELEEKIHQSGITQKDNWFTDIQAEVTAAKTKSNRQVDKYSRGLGLGATEADKATFELMKFSNELVAMNEILHREQSLAMKDSEKYLELQDKLEGLVQSVQETKIKYIQAQYTENIKQMEHNNKMRWYGKDNENDLLGRQRATDAARDEMYKLRQLVAKYRAIEKEAPENQQALDETLELIKESAVKVQEAMTKYSKAMRDGFYKVSEEFLFEAKSFKDIITDLWQDLGKDSLKVLFRQDVSNPSFLGQWLGLGMPKKENLTEDAFYQFSKEGALNSLDALSDALARTGSPLLSKLKDTNFALEKSMDLSKILETDHMLALKLNTLAIQNLTTAMGLSNANSATNGLLGAVTGGGWFGNLGSNMSAFYKPGGGAATAAGSVTKMLLGTATGGRLGVDGNLLSRFADGGRLHGAGSGRSDSILAYLANKDKFVWLSNGEYVINEKSAKALGYDTLDALNKYADGGALATSVTNPTPYIPTINPQTAQKAIHNYGSTKMTEALLREQNKQMKEQNEMLRNMGNNSDSGGKMVVLNTQASSADVLRALQENPRALQAILGRQKSMGFR